MMIIERSSIIRAAMASKTKSKTCSSPTHLLMPASLMSILFFLTHASMPFIARNGPDTLTRGCQPYDRCHQAVDQATVLIRYGENLTSEGGRFQLGFFVLQNNTYLGIWYSGTNPAVIVWVANRDKPISSQGRQNCSLVLDHDGNAKVFASNNDHYSYWSTSATIMAPKYNRTELKLLNNGNLQLTDNGGARRTTLWQSFNHPTDTFLPEMADFRTSGANLTSWESPENPAQGQFVFQKQNNEQDSLTISNNKSIILEWDSSYSFLHPKLYELLYNNMTGSYSSLRLVMNASGNIQLWELQRGKEWKMLWNAPKDVCDLYNSSCGNYGVCNAGNSFTCKCLPGFEPTDPNKWESKDFSGGCSKKNSTPCGERFLNLPMIKVPPPPGPILMKNEATCRTECLSTNNCRCKAYSYDSVSSNCLIWIDDPDHIQEEYYYNDNNQTLHVRVDSSDIEFGSRTWEICGTNVIPYPLSTGGDCGDPSYLSFQCNATNGQVYFNAPSGNPYKVSHINPDQRTFVVQLTRNSTSDHCDASNIKSKVMNSNTSVPFNVINCSIVCLMNRPDVFEVEISWKRPPKPACNSSADCKDWPLTTCALDKDRKKVCICDKGFHWNPVFLNCTQVHHKHVSLWLKAGIPAASATVLLLLSIILFILHLRRTWTMQRAGNIVEFKTDDMEDIDIPFVDYESILAATDRFSDANKLGAGGFGPVYKGKLANGDEIAIKRLSAASAQGIEEFRNEVVLIAKLQHRNLVRVLGYCVKADEKILIYEYMPNKSLDSFLFDHTISPSLDWKKRFNIILGVARGLLYLHQDSRLRIIHRDLKPSNILLDKELNPKISDFGLARIVGGNENATSTARVVGTYGYMSPEYALDGYFSIKSDVYSFGIVVLEVVSGKRSTSLLRFDNNLISLLGYAWTLWDKGEALELVDKLIVDSYDSFEVKRCINVGLLCVQEDPSDRPTMSTVLLMLGGDNMNLPYPKQPVFVARRPPAEAASSSSKFATSSNVELTTTVQGR